MTKLTIATFNCENLFRRFKFRDKITKKERNKAVTEGFIIDKKLFENIKEPERAFTAYAIKDTEADIIALQEVENMDTLKEFQTLFLKNYPYKYLIDGNDPRLIDVAVLSKYEAKFLKTHQFDRSEKSKIFSRDCLEIEFRLNGATLTLFVNHFKSMLGGRDKTMLRRKQQSERVAEIIKDKFGTDPGTENFVVLGDLNDYVPSNGLSPLIDQPWLENVIAKRLPDGENWTHWYDGDNSVAQLDYILLSKRIATHNPASVPLIVRKGLSKNCTQYKGARYDGIGWSRPHASDHCPAAIRLDLN